MTQTQHTPLPWRVGAGDMVTQPAGYGSAMIADCRSRDYSPATCRANAAFIVRAVNSHADLLAACEAALGCSTFHPDGRVASADLTAIRGALPMIRAALAKGQEG